MTDARTPLIAGNWKLNKGIGEAVSFVTDLEQRLESVTAPCDIVLAPVFTALHAVAKNKQRVSLAAQDLYWEPSGAFTGEVSAALIADAGCTHAIVGHSERRQFFGENDAGVNRKIKASLAASLCPIVCVGETLEQREAGSTLQVVLAQVDGAFEGLSAEELLRCVLAYEPVWAIGTGRTASPSDAQEVHEAIRKQLHERYGATTADQIRILYGGSVKPANAKELMSMVDIDGALVGGASLDVESFDAIIRAST